MTTRNVAAERLERFLGTERREEIHDLALHGLLDDALAAERRATVERIREAVSGAQALADSLPHGWPDAVDLLLDEVQNKDSANSEVKR